MAGLTPTSSSIALVADDPRLAEAVGRQLRAGLGVPIAVCGFREVRTHFGPDIEKVLVFASSSPAETGQVKHLLQEIAINRFPCIMFFLAGSEQVGQDQLQALGPLITRKLDWPADADLLQTLLRERLKRIDPAADDGSIQGKIRRSLGNRTPSLLPLLEQIAIAALHDVTVLLTGETGTGKSYLARLIHDCSERVNEPFIVVPCGAQPPNLLESAFFGHVRGAFTGADRDKVGKIEAAGGGTVLLDEIDTLPLEQQASLLRVIETGEFEPVGSNETRRARARFIVTSNWDLERAVGEGKFRKDLYYRLNVMSFHLPALRERIGDIAPLARSLVARFTTKFRKDLLDVPPLTIEALQTYPWPGNIRELENALQQAVLMSRGQQLLPDFLPREVREYTPEPPEDGVAGSPDSLSYNRQLTEKAVIQRALVEHGYSRSRAAGALRISRVTLYKKMKKYGLMDMPFTPSNP
jgi:DNA-binding NtrC family response regulator